MKQNIFHEELRGLNTKRSSAFSFEIIQRNETLVIYLGMHLSQSWMISGNDEIDKLLTCKVSNNLPVDHFTLLVTWRIAYDIVFLFDYIHILW